MARAQSAKAQHTVPDCEAAMNGTARPAARRGTVENAAGSQRSSGEGAQTAPDAALTAAPGRTVWLDAVRILACFGVIYNHAVGPSVVAGNAAAPFWTLFAYQLCKLAVPMFFMISGALLLGKIDSYRKLFSRIGRIAAALAVFTYVYYAVYCYDHALPFDWKMGLLCVVRDRIGLTSGFWFLYRYLALLVMLPLLQRMAAGMRGRDFLVYLGISILVCGSYWDVSFFASAALPNGYLAIPLYSVYIGMLIMGHCIHRYLAPNGRWALMAAAGLLVWNAAAAYLTLAAQRVDLARAAGLDRCERGLVVLAAGCLFYLAKCLFAWRLPSPRAARAVTGVARWTFCAFLVSDLFLDHLTGVRAWLATGLTPHGAAQAYALIVFAASLAAGAVLTRVPGLKKIL